MTHKGQAFSRHLFNSQKRCFSPLSCLDLSLLFPSTPPPPSHPPLPPLPPRAWWMKQGRACCCFDKRGQALNQRVLLPECLVQTSGQSWRTICRASKSRPITSEIPARLCAMSGTDRRTLALTQCAAARIRVLTRDPRGKRESMSSQQLKQMWSLPDPKVYPAMHSDPPAHMHSFRT
eukprot:2655960-Rhodomonas_salina.1